jgi:hypothetical protein
MVDGLLFQVQVRVYRVWSLAGVRRDLAVLDIPVAVKRAYFVPTMRSDPGVPIVAVVLTRGKCKPRRRIPDVGHLLRLLLLLLRLLVLFLVVVYLLRRFRAHGQGV